MYDVAGTKLQLAEDIIQKLVDFRTGASSATEIATDAELQVKVMTENHQRMNYVIDQLNQTGQHAEQGNTFDDTTQL
ncbi:hypothetical protein [Desulfosporosinus metallidurans]|uniref:Uncharacterized protein n=1 Tax=Desulfosporosinus metallidurans TaxID=1888891 RepID=A0A1Q8QN69_9FIRM|nr:hypothetical protein [Desulfosporosinus metallidurans]OLN28786.1 hypothetical protein DSOL_3863 [Desulfosporosinus metallidurans]